MDVKLWMMKSSINGGKNEKTSATWIYCNHAEEGKKCTTSEIEQMKWCQEKQLVLIAGRTVIYKYSIQIWEFVIIINRHIYFKYDYICNRVQCFTKVDDDVKHYIFSNFYYGLPKKNAQDAHLSYPDFAHSHQTVVHESRLNM